MCYTKKIYSTLLYKSSHHRLVHTLVEKKKTYTRDLPVDMIRFSLRHRNRRHTSKSTPTVVYPPPPARRPDGMLMDYFDYQPSPHAHNNKQIVRMVVDVDSDTMRRYQGGQIMGVKERIRARVVRLRDLLSELEQMPDAIQMREQLEQLDREINDLKERLAVNRGQLREMRGGLRKGSRRLARLGSRGLVRRMSRVKVDDKGREEAEKQLKKLEQEEAEAELRERLLEEKMKKRRKIHVQVMEVLDEFYGGKDGWENDQVARTMLSELADMTEAGLEAERDLAEARKLRDGALAAKQDWERGLREVTSVRKDVESVLEGNHRMETAISPETVLWQRLETSTRVASECGLEMNAIARGLEALKDSNDSKQMTQATRVECIKMERHGKEVVAMIQEDVNKLERRVERCEEYVIMERVAILNQHHPP